MSGDKAIASVAMLEHLVGTVARNFIAMDRAHVKEIAELEDQLKVLQERLARRLNQWDRLTLALHGVADRKEKVTPERLRALIDEATA